MEQNRNILPVSAYLINNTLIFWKFHHTPRASVYLQVISCLSNLWNYRYMSWWFKNVILLWRWRSTGDVIFSKNERRAIWYHLHAKHVKIVLCQKISVLWTVKKSSFCRIFKQPWHPDLTQRLIVRIATAIAYTYRLPTMYLTEKYGIIRIVV